MLNLNTKILLVIVSVFLIFLITIKSIHYFCTDIIEIKVSQMIHVKIPKGDGFYHQYCLYTYDNKGCFYIGTDYLRGIFNKEALYFEFEEDSTYTVKVHGLIPFRYPYIIKIIK